MTEQNIKEWAEHACDFKHGGPCIGKAMWHAERRELAQMVLNPEHTCVSECGRDCPAYWKGRAEKVEAARAALAANLERAQLVAANERRQTEYMEEARDALAAALIPLAKLAAYIAPARTGTLEVMLVDGLSRATEVLDTHVPGWREK